MKITKYINGKTVAGAVGFALLGICKDGLKTLQKNRERRLRKEQNQKDWEERQRQCEEDAMPEGELEIIEINGIQHYKNRFGNWCPLESKTTGDIKITTNKKGGKA
jgi:hypothetical protein